MSPDELASLSAVELAAMIRARKVAPVEVTKGLLARIEKLNPALNAFVTVHTEVALCSAAKAEETVMSGQRVGPLHGVPLHVKDNLFVGGSRTMFGSKLTETNVTADDCPAVAASLEKKLATQGDLLDPGLRRVAEEGLKLRGVDFANALAARHDSPARLRGERGPEDDRP